MMNNIFSSFNPINYFFFFYLILNILMCFHFLKIFKNIKFLKYFLNINLVMKDSMNKMNNSNLKMNILLMLFFFIMITNLLNLNSYSFCLNSQINLLFFVSLNLWLSCILYSILFYSKKFFIHLTPYSCPMFLSFFMVIIEMISLLIRPLTLSVRMAANMLAGHLLIHLLVEFSMFLFFKNMMSLILTFMIFIILNLLELGVSLIQPYIFCMLINMYLCENIN